MNYKRVLGREKHNLVNFITLKIPLDESLQILALLTKEYYAVFASSNTSTYLHIISIKQYKTIFSRNKHTNQLCYKNMKHNNNLLVISVFCN